MEKPVYHWCRDITVMINLQRYFKQSANQMGYPVLLKATAGGGGKGMRVVWSEPEFDDALVSAKREAMKGFSDDRMLVDI